MYFSTFWCFSALFFLPRHLPLCPGPSHDRLNGGWHLYSSWHATSQFSHSSAEHTSVSKCAAGVHDWKQNCGCGEHNTHYGGWCSTELCPMPQLMSMWSGKTPTKNQQRDVLAVEVRDKIPPYIGDATSRLGIQVYLIRLSFTICQLAKPFFQICIPSSHHCKWRKTYVFSHLVKS